MHSPQLVSVADGAGHTPRPHGRGHRGRSRVRSPNGTSRARSPWLVSQPGSMLLTLALRATGLDRGLATSPVCARKIITDLTKGSCRISYGLPRLMWRAYFP